MRIGILSGAVRETEILQKALSQSAEHRVLWSARTGTEAIALSMTDTPDVVLLDLLVGREDGLDAIRQMTASGQCAVLIITSSVLDHSAQVFEAMGHGALDVVEMPGPSDPPAGESGARLLAKLAIIARLIAERSTAHVSRPVSQHVPPRSTQPVLVAIGASAGGPKALATLLHGLPRDFPAAIVIIQHVEAQFANGMAEWLNDQCAVTVAVALEGDYPQVGRVLLAGTGDHLAMKKTGRLSYTPEPREYAYRPSIDVFFNTVSCFWKGDVVGVLLTGMGRDGALGLKALRNLGHHTIAQDQLSSAVYGMPKAAATLRAAVEILPMDKIAARLIDVVGGQPVALTKRS